MRRRWDGRRRVAKLLVAGIQVGYAPTIATTLTSSELKIARLAVDGVLDREIAQSLFVTPRSVQLTVEFGLLPSSASTRWPHCARYSLPPDLGRRPGGPPHRWWRICLLSNLSSPTCRPPLTSAERSLKSDSRSPQAGLGRVSRHNDLTNQRTQRGVPS